MGTDVQVILAHNKVTYLIIKQESDKVLISPYNITPE